MGSVKTKPRAIKYDRGVLLKIKITKNNFYFTDIHRLCEIEIQMDLIFFSF
jgi:hypothetical protein